MSEDKNNIIQEVTNEEYKWGFVTDIDTDTIGKGLNDSNNYSNIATINNIEANWAFRALCLINEDILCVGGSNSKGFYLVNISTHQLIKTIAGPKEIYSIYKCIDGLILCSIKNGNGDCVIAKYKYENQEMKKIVEKEKIHNGNINTCCELDDGTVASGGEDKLIKSRFRISGCELQIIYGNKYMGRFY